LQKRLARLTDIFRGGAGQQKLYGAKGEQTSMTSRSILASA
jgi:flagella synthesis protein FlgN